LATQIHTSVLALGANQKGPWGQPESTIQRAIIEIGHLGLHVGAASRLIVSRPVGPVRQPSYRNCVVRIDGTFPPARVLRELKSLERDAGRRSGPRWGPRPLDIDIICVGGRTIAGWARHSTAVRLALPHPAMAVRDFVLGPMTEVAPQWRHPYIGLKPRELLLQRAKPRPGPRRGLRA
jgi:2-amino-4-hydroxy-6-hydroxymethyldihydropteridine diphosphokinase